MRKRIKDTLKSYDDINRIKESCDIVRVIMDNLKKMDLADQTTYEIDAYIEKEIISNKARPSFKTIPGYNFSSCISINNEVVHGIPSKKIIVKKGDIIKIDIGAVKKGFFSDVCRTFPVGEISESEKLLIDIGHDALAVSIDQVYAGNRIGNIGYTIQSYVEKHGYNVVKDLTGHGVGFAVHEPPAVFHYGKKNSGILIEEGMVLAIEPIVNEGSDEIVFDNWTVKTKDGLLSVQFEDTVAVMKTGPIILTRS